jgi:type IV pilus assembly protein PilQ
LSRVNILFCIIFVLVCPLKLSFAEDAASDNAQKPAGQEQKAVEKQEVSPAPLAPLEERLNQLISLDLRNIDILEALKFIASKGSLNIVATKNVTGRVTLTLENIPLKDVFDLMLRSNGLAFVMKGEIFNVMTEIEYKAFYGKNFSDMRVVKVFRLKYAIPEQAFSLLDAIKSDLGRVLVDQESGNVLIMDLPGRIVQMQQALDEFEKQNLVTVFTLKYAKAKDVEEILKTRLDMKKLGSIKADERNNQVIVQTLSDRMDEVKRLVRKLDKPTKEVMIDTKIVKITLSDQLDTGIEWEGIFRLTQRDNGASYFGSTPFSRITSGVANPTFTTRADTLAALGNNIASYPFSGTTSSLSSSAKTVLGENMHFGVINNNKDYDMMINYLNTIGKSRVLSNPRMVVVNNQEAKIHIGERQAYVTTTTSTGQSTSTVSEEVQFVDVGIQLSVTPTINDDGYITMKVRPEVSTVSSTLTTPTGNKIPIIDTSLTETTVMMIDGTTLLIGGLRKEEKANTSQGLPFLGDIPFLGRFFKTASDKTTRTELLVMITPHIITGEELDIGDERAFGDKPGKEYQDYAPIVPDKEMLPHKDIAPKIDIKPYRDYLGEKVGGEPQIKEVKYGQR